MLSRAVIFFLIIAGLVTGVAGCRETPHSWAWYNAQTNERYDDDANGAELNQGGEAGEGPLFPEDMGYDENE